MVKSMTGYGRATGNMDGLSILVELKSVNHRYLEITPRVPRAYGYLEDKLKSLLQKKLSRGKVELHLTINHLEGTDAAISVNMPIAEGYVDALREVAESLYLEDNLKLSDLARLPDVFTVQKTEEDEEEIWRMVSSVAEQAVSNFIDMRETEGARMKADILSRLDYLEEAVQKIETLSPRATEAYRLKLTKKISDLLQDSTVDQQRILTEAAIFSEKVAVDEETVRLRSHITQYRELLEKNEAVGKKLDFLTQELNRETNTIGSKAQDLDITRLVVDMKSEIEKIREQIQNIE